MKIISMRQVKYLWLCGKKHEQENEWKFKPAMNSYLGAFNKKIKLFLWSFPKAMSQKMITVKNKSMEYFLKGKGNFFYMETEGCPMILYRCTCILGEDRMIGTQWDQCVGPLKWWILINTGQVAQYRREKAILRVWRGQLDLCSQMITCMSPG